MTKNKRNVLSLLAIFSASSQVYANNSLVSFTESDREDNSVTINILKDDSVKILRLPNGNMISGEAASFTVNRNGIYDFVGYDEKGKMTTYTYKVSDLRKNMLGSNQREITLSLESEDLLSGMGEMKFKNSSEDWTEYEPFAETKEWTLSDNEGSNNVHVMFKDIAGNETERILEGVFLDTKGPEISFVINNDDEYTKTKDVTLNIRSALDDFSEVEYLLISNDNINFTKVPFSEDIDWVLEDEFGVKIVYMKGIDSFGNESETVSIDDIYYDNILPQGSVTIENGADTVPSNEVKIQVNFDDFESGVKRVTIIEDDKRVDIPIESTEIDWVLSLGDNKFVTIEIEDNAGNIYVSDSNVVQIASFKITQFVLSRVVNPIAFPNNSFTPLTWDFDPQPMLSGANIEFMINYDMMKSSNSVSVVTGEYVVEIDGPNNYNHKIMIPYSEIVSNGFKATVKIPDDAPSGSKVYTYSYLECETTSSSGGKFNSEAHFPGEEQKAQIGFIGSNIMEGLLFNEIN